MNPLEIEAIKRVHPDATIEKLHLDPIIANPLTGVATCSVCYYELTPRTTRTWYGRKTLTVARTHKHFTATYSETRPWEYVGTDEMPPYPVYEALRARMDVVVREQVKWLSENPNVLADGFYRNIDRLDAISRELVYEALLNGQYGDELRTFVRREDRARQSVN